MGLATADELAIASCESGQIIVTFLAQTDASLATATALLARSIAVLGNTVPFLVRLGKNLALISRRLTTITQATHSFPVFST